MREGRDSFEGREHHHLSTSPVASSPGRSSEPVPRMELYFNEMVVWRTDEGPQNQTRGIAFGLPDLKGERL